MKKIVGLVTSLTSVDVYHVISEPGDATHYDYIVIRDFDDFMFVPYGNTFRYPQKINVYEIETDQIAIATREHCNPYTVAECVRTIKELIRPPTWERIRKVRRGKG